MLTPIVSLHSLSLSQCSRWKLLSTKWEEKHYDAINELGPGSETTHTKANGVKHNGEHQDERWKMFCGVFLSSSFVLSIASPVVDGLIPRPHLYWSGHKTNLLMWIFISCCAIEMLQKHWNCKQLKLFCLLDASTMHAGKHQTTTSTNQQGAMWVCTTSNYKFTEL